MEPKNLIGGLIAGTAIGIAIGILLAPESGEKTKKKLADASGKFADDVKDAVLDCFASLKTVYNKEVEEAADKGKQMVDEGADSVKA